MANETKEIGDIVKKCRILLLDIEGTTTSISFVKDKLFPYAEEHVQKFLETEWEKEDVKEAVGALRKLALEDQENKVEGVVTIPGEDASKEEQISGLVGNVKWQMSADRKAGPLKQLQGLIWKQGYDNGDIKGHVYDDVPAALDQWRSTEGKKVYIYSSGSVQAQKLLFGQSVAGDLLPRIDGHYDTAVGHKQEAASYTAIAEKIGVKPEEILFLTDIMEEATAALAAGLQAALVCRSGSGSLPSLPSLPSLRSLAALAPSNKRTAPEPQEEETPAKVPKTDAEMDVKAAAEATAAAQETEKETMEVETPATETEKAEEKTEEPVKVVTTIEEITDSNEATDAPMIDVEPVVEEEHKTEEKQTDTDAAKIESDSEKPKEDVEMKNGDAPVAEETPPATGPVIEEVTHEKDAVANAEDTVPVVEEPPATEDMDVLHNVGEVLEKECDEILSKVQDVTNLDSIPVKPLLHPIAEETMETENTDSNDIVDGILDTELELEMKQNEILITAAENRAKAENGVNNAESNEQAKGTDAEIADENVESKVVEESSPVEVATEAKPKEESAVKAEVKETMETVVTDSKDSEENVKVAEVEEMPEKVEEKTVTEENKTEPETIKESKSVEEKPVEETAPATVAPVESTPAEQKVTEPSKPEETEPSKAEETEPQVNGKATNGDAPKMNGDGDACSRIPVVNGNENVENGSNGDSKVGEKGQGDSKVEEVPDIKVKTVPPVEPAAPVEQPTEA